jgi:hypothetical protein
MRAWLPLLLLGACLPDTGDFGPSDASGTDGGVVDAGPTGGSTDAFEAPDLGEDPLAGCDPLLPCVRSCDDALFDSLLWQPDFGDGFPDDMTLVSGTVYGESDTLVFERDEMDTFSTARSSAGFSDALLCARLRMPGGGEGVSANLFAIGFLTGSGGVELFLDGREEELSFLSAEVLPDGVLLGTADYGWDAAHELVVLVYLSGETTYAEVLDLATSESFAFPGTYRGEMVPGFAWFSAGEPKVLEPVVLLEAKVGRPSASALAAME